MTLEHEELEVAVYDTGFAANKNLLISNGGMISGSSIVDVKVSFFGKSTERKSLSVGDSLKYDAGDQGIFEIRLIRISEGNARFLVSQIK